MFRLCQRLTGVRHLVNRKAINVPKVQRMPSFLVVRYANTDETAKIAEKVNPEDAVKNAEKRVPSRKTISVVWVMLIVCVSVMIGLTHVVDERKKKRLKQRQTNQIKAFGEALIGGPFNLLTMDNKPVTNTDFLGKWLLIYFGFTHCPDVCPDMLEKIASAVDILEKSSKTEPFVPLFISVDPERDTPQAITNYLNEFSSKIVGLTGTLEEIKKVCKSYRIYHSQGPKDLDNDYIVDHSIFIFLMRPDGKFADMFSPTDEVDYIVEKTTTVMSEYLKTKADEIEIVEG